jgi:hypothetical protein
MKSQRFKLGVTITMFSVGEFTDGNVSARNHKSPRTAPRLTTDANLLLVGATVSETGGIVLLPWDVIPTGVATASEPGNYTGPGPGFQWSDPQRNHSVGLVYSTAWSRLESSRQKQIGS